VAGHRLPPDGAYLPRALASEPGLLPYRRPNHDIALTSPPSVNDPGSTHTWTSWRQITQEIVNARVWEECISGTRTTPRQSPA
jgi:hypothetical protein